MSHKRIDVDAAPAPLGATAHAERASDCADVSAYLDGELSAPESSSFERHVKFCVRCAESLDEQRRLLCLLDAAFSRAHKKDAPPPEDFVRVVKARAQTDVRGVRGGTERRRALALTAALACLSLALVGFRAVGDALRPLRTLADALAATLDMTLHTVAELFAGAALILRSVGRLLLSAPGGGGLTFIFTALACALLLLFCLISDYHRRHLPD